MRALLIPLLAVVGCSTAVPAPPPPMTAKEAAAEELRKVEEAERKKRDTAARAILKASVGSDTLGSSDLRDLVGLIAVEGWNRKESGFTPISITSPRGRTVRVTGSRPAETQWVWGAWSGEVRNVQRGLPGRPARGWANRLRDTTNLLLHDRLGGDLFDMTAPGTFRRQPLIKLLAGLKTKPADRIWGTTAKAVYPMFKPVVREYMGTHAVLTANGGRAKALEAMDEFAAKNPHGHYLDLYDRYSTEKKITAKVHFRSRWAATYVTGFWMRRMRDGTDDVIADHLAGVLKSFDPKFKY